MNWRQATVLVTGGAGFLGSVVVERLRAAGCTQIVVPRSAHCDLRNRAAVRELLESSKPAVVFHLAARVGGIGANEANAGQFFYDNAIMGIELLEQARLARVPKVVLVGSVCAYPKHAPVPFQEDLLWDGYPDESNAPYGLAKKMLLVQSQAYRRQYDLNSIYLLPANLYGPGDNFDLATSHVIPAIVRKCVEARDAGERTVRLWGDGSASREFLYVEDAARGLLLAAEHYDRPEPVNLGTGKEITICDLASLVAAEVGFDGEFSWDGSRPNGQPRRWLATERAERFFGFRATTPLREGLRTTVAWYCQHRSRFK